MPKNIYDCQSNSPQIISSTSMGALKAVVIDDEPKGLISLNNELLRHAEHINVVQSFHDPREGVAFLNQNKVDVLFLDVEMPELSGFDVLKAIDTAALSVVIVSAFEKYGIQAIKAGTLDYLLKPLVRTEVDDCIGKLLEVGRKAAGGQEMISIPVNGGFRVVKTNDVEQITSDNSYVKILYADGNAEVVARSIREFETTLSANQFVRVDNRVIVNLKRVKTYKGGIKPELEMQNGNLIKISRRRLKHFKSVAGDFFG